MSKRDDESRSADVVDFDALNAALGGLPAPSPSSPKMPVAHGSVPPVSDSEGRSSANYASARPHPIPPTRQPSEDLNAPPVIVATDATPTLESLPPNMTMPLDGRRASPGVQQAGRPRVPGGTVPLAPYTPQPFAVQSGLPIQGHMENAQRTQRIEQVQAMARAQAQAVARGPVGPRTPTLVLERREPTKGQKLLVFLAMLVVVVSGGLAVLIYYKPSLFYPDAYQPSTTLPPATDTATMTGSGPNVGYVQSTASAAPSTSTTPLTTTAWTTLGGSVPAPSSSPSAVPTTSVKKPRFGH